MDLRRPIPVGQGEEFFLFYFNIFFSFSFSLNESNELVGSLRAHFLNESILFRETSFAGLDIPRSTHRVSL